MFFFIKEKSILRALNVLEVIFFRNLAQSTKCDYLGYFPCTSPIIKKSTYISFFKNFFKNKKHYDSFNSVSVIKKFLWKSNHAINYNTYSAPNSQDLPNNFYSLTFGLNLISKKKMVELKNIVGKKPNFFPLSKIETVDIDDKVDFEMVKGIYPKLFKK